MKAALALPLRGRSDAVFSPSSDSGVPFGPLRKHGRSRVSAETAGRFRYPIPTTLMDQIHHPPGKGSCLTLQFSRDVER